MAVRLHMKLGVVAEQRVYNFNGLASRRIYRDLKRRDHVGLENRRSRQNAAAEDDVWAAALQDRRAGTGCTARTDQRAHELNGRAARKAGDLERVELVARLGDEPSLDPIRRPGEGHCDPARAKRLRHRQRRQHVAGRSARGDQAPETVGLPFARGRAHRPRC